MIENVNQNASRTYQVNRFFEVVVVFEHAIIVVWTALPLTFLLSFKIVGEPKSRILQNDRIIAPEHPTAEFLYTGSLDSA